MLQSTLVCSQNNYLHILSVSYISDFINYDYDVVAYLLAANICTLGIAQILALYDSIQASQTLIDENALLVKSVEKYMKESWTGMEDFQMNLALRDIKDFDGFDGRNYFHLNKSLIVGLAANFLTYFIILVQFKVV